MQFDQHFNYSVSPFDAEIKAIRNPRLLRLGDATFESFHKVMESLPRVKTKHIILDQPIIEIGREDELNPTEHQLLKAALEAFIPWKKGPFKIFGHLIDAEWRSDMKWARIEPHVSSLQGKVVADIGCNNGYFMFRMAAHKPAQVIGFEPYAKHLLVFHLLQHFAHQSCLKFDLLGMEHLDYFPQVFDTIFCLGILYHHTDPVGLLRKMFHALKPGGEAIVECQGVLDKQSYALVPAGRYAQARGIWNLPTPSCLEAWMSRTNFRDIEIFSAQLLSTAEQRCTEWAPIKSLKDFLDPSDPTLTIEGYPAPARIYVRARR